MKNSLPLQENKKLSVTYRVEDGCLGPDGKSHVARFCNFAQAELRSLDSGYIAWHVIPRISNTSPEIQYNVVGKRMNHSQAEKYLAVFNKSLDEFECHFSDKLATLIDKFMGY